MTRPRARLIAFLALLTFGAFQWIRLLDPSPAGRTVWFLLVCFVAAVALRRCNALDHRRRWIGTAAITVVLLVLAFLAAGIPASLVLDPRAWDDLASGIGQGLGTLPSMRIPYRGAEVWARDTLTLLGFLIVVVALLLACLPRGDARPGHPIAAAVAVG